jgi:hypothetical protein
MTTTTAHPPSVHAAATPMVRTAAVGACGILLGFAGLQVALATGAPLGEHVWGGTQDRQLPNTMRVASGAAAVVLTSAAWVVARRGGVIERPGRWLTPATWGIAGYLALNTLGNVASTSNVERFAFGPATAAASALTAFVAYRTRRN